MNESTRFIVVVSFCNLNCFVMSGENRKTCKEKVREFIMSFTRTKTYVC